MSDSAVSALNAFSVGTQVIANNLANINTDDFQGARARYSEAVPPGQGVALEEIRRDSSAGAPLPQDSIDISAEAQRRASNVQAEREFVDLTAHQRAYEANARVARTYEDMLGTVVDMVV